MGYTKWESRYPWSGYEVIKRRMLKYLERSGEIPSPQNYLKLSSWGKPVQPLGNVSTIYRCTGLKKHTDRGGWIYPTLTAISPTPTLHLAQFMAFSFSKPNQKDNYYAAISFNKKSLKCKYFNNNVFSWLACLTVVRLLSVISIDEQVINNIYFS